MLLLHLLGASCLLRLHACRAAPQQPAAARSPAPLSVVQSNPGGRKLHGRFLHITDFHPDPFFKTYSSTEEEAACHRKHGPAGIYGAETSGCDSPISLVNETFKWINENLRDSIDFIIWTGDSARHDNDEKIPRTHEEVIQQNEFLVSKFAEVFGNEKSDPYNDFVIPIVPTFGNNDIMPHNIFLSGPNKWTMKYLEVWKGFIPEEQRHQFQQGGWFFVEVIPRKLAVFSLNTMYFFDSNSGVDGCADKHEPGYEHMEWLRIQLQILRERGMKAILIGHVPPARTDSKLSWDETCWQKFTLWEQQFRDVIVGSLFGHMNIDHFMLQDFKDLKKDTRNGRMGSAGVKSQQTRQNMLEDGEITVASASDYLQDLGNAWSKLPVPPPSKKKKSISDLEDEELSFSTWDRVQFAILGSKKGKKGKKGKGGKGGKGRKGTPKEPTKKEYLKKIGGRYAERYSVTHVSPSVVPNYFPTLRVFTYNISGLEDVVVPSRWPDEQMSNSSSSQSRISSITRDFDGLAYENEMHQLVALKGRKKDRESRKKPKKWKFKVPAGPSKSSPPGPAYSLQPLTFLSYTQYFANLTHINNDFVEDPNTNHLTHNPTINEDNYTIFGLEYDPQSGSIQPAKWKEGKHGKHQGKRPRQKPHPKKFKYEVEYDTKHDKLFKLKDLTVRSYVDLARRIGHDKSGTKDLASESDDDEFDEFGKIDDNWDLISDSEDDRITTDDDETESFSPQKGKNNGKDKKKKKKKKHHDHNGAWFTFVKRAFVGTLDPAQVERVFTAPLSSSPSNERHGCNGEEITEL